MSKETKFIILQASVVFNNQMSIFDGKYEDTKEGRNAAFKDLIQKFKDKRILKINPRITEYILVYKAQINDDIIYCQLARRTQIDTFRLSENDIKQEQIDNYPPLDLFINLQKQQFAVQVDTSILAKNTVETALRNLMNSLTKEFSLFINAIQDNKEFWKLVDQEDEIQEISFDLIVPNFFNATGEANELVSKAKEALNADCVGLSIKNKKGRLKAEISAIDSYVKYASLTGSWKLRIKKPGTSKYQTINSTDCNLQKTIEDELLTIIKKADDNWQVDTDIYNGLIERISGLFE